MVFIKALVIVLLSFILSSCASKNIEQKVGSILPIDNATLAKVPPPVSLTGSNYKKFDIFEGRTFTMSANNLSFNMLLFAVASDLGLNLIVDPEVSTNNKMTVNFNKTPIKDALSVIMDMSDTFYEIRGNVLIVKKYATRNFSIPYMPSTTVYDAQLGGDVLGGAGENGDTLSTALKGNFSVNYKRPEGTSDFYSEVEKNIATILGVESGKGGDNFFAINRSTGSITIHTTRNKMTRVENFFKEIFPRAVRQVLIEARIVDVMLSDDFNYGIDWSKVVGSATIAQTLAIGGVTAGSVIVTDPRNTFSAMINAISKYGNTDTLANPRLMVMNGQTAIISAGTVTPFWERETIENLGSNSPTTLNTTYTRSNILDGILLGVTPFVNDDGTITINIIPVSTSIQETKSIIENDVVLAEAPILNIKEAGTIVRVDNGATVIMGGLINTIESVKNSRVPFLGDIPILGYLFRSQEKIKSKRELVIFLKPTIVYSSGNEGNNE